MKSLLDAQRRGLQHPPLEVWDAPDGKALQSSTPFTAPAPSLGEIEALAQTSSAAAARSQDTARKYERSQSLAIARCLRRRGRQVDSDVDEAVELVAVASTSYGATTVTPRAPPPPVAAASTAPKPGRRRG